MSKSLKITIAVVVAVLVIASIVGLIFLLAPTKVPNTSLTQRLATPKNVSINQSTWVLSYDPVENAEGYQIFINDADTFVTTKTSVSVERYITKYAKYSFEVSAIHSTSDYNSLRSTPIYGYNTTTLETPLNLSWEGDTLSWLAVENAQSYNVALKYKPIGAQNEITTTISTQANSFDFGALITQAPYSQINFFELSVQASSTDAYDNTNPYIYNSQYSDPAIYFRTTSIEAPVIRISPDVRNQTTQQGTARTLSWDVDFAVEEYWVYINGQLRKTVTADELVGLSTYSLDLNTILVDGVAIADTMGTKTIYVTAIPKTNEYYHIDNRTSETIEYTVVHKLSAPNASSIKMKKEGGNLVITWDPVVDTYGVSTRYTPTSYNLILLTNSDTENPSYVARAPVTDLLLPTYSIPLSELSALGVSFKAQICAIDNKSEYILDSDYSELSEAYEAVTKLDTPDGISLNESNGVDTLTWRAVQEADSYTVMVYMGSIDPDTNQISAIGSALVTQNVSENKLIVSNYMKAHLPDPLEPGLYAIKVVANSLSQFFTSSDPSEPVKYDYKVRLATPTIYSVSKVQQPDNKGAITMTFDYIEGAQRYYINVNGILAFIMEQPSLENEIVTSYEIDGKTTYRIVEKTRLTDFINNNYSSPKVHSITVQAVILDTSTANGYISSLLSVEYKFSDYYTHAMPTHLVTTQEAGSNVVTLTWDSVPSVESSNGTYEIFVIDGSGNRSAVNTADIVGNSVADLSPYLQLGSNTIEIRSARVGLYLASDYASITYNYVYQLSGTANTTITPIAGSKNNRLVIEASANTDFRYVTDYYIEFLNSEGVLFNYTNVHLANAGADVDVVLGEEFLPLYKTTTVKIYAGKIRQGDLIISQSTYLNPNGCEWSVEYESNSFMESPTISHSETADGKVYATISVQSISLPFTQSIEWHFAGTTGINYTDYIYITDTSTNSFTIDLTALQLVNDENGNLLGGGYSIYATAISSSSTELRSAESVYTFSIIIDLDTPSGFVMADDHSYLQWNYISNVDHYVISLDGVEKTGAVIGEYTDYIGGQYVPVMRVDTSSWFSGLSKGQSVTFTVKAVATENGYYRDSSANFNWEFNNKLNSPKVEIVTKNNQLCLQILYNRLVASYTVKCTSISAGLDINTDVSTIENGYVYFNIEAALTDKYAGTYTFKVYANPIDSTYDTSDASVVEVNWQKRFAQPTISVTQNFDNNTLTFSWNDVSVNTVGADDSITMVPPSGYLVTVTSAGVSEAYVTRTINETSLILTANELATMTSGYYFVSVTALANGAMLDSFESAYRFAYQQQLSIPEIAFVSGDTLANTETLDIKQTGEIDTNAPKFDLKVVDSNSVETIFEGLAWSGSIGTLLGGTHFTERGVYTISVRNAQNGSLAASAWSNSLEVRYGVSFDVAENIKMTYSSEDSQYTVSFDAVTLPEGVSDVVYSATVTYNGIVQNIASDEISLVSGNSYSFSFENSSWGDAWREGAQFKIVITATTTYDLAPTSSTTYIFIIGDMVAPYDLTMTNQGANVTITWKGDVNCTDIVYSYKLGLLDENGTNHYLTSTGTWTTESAQQGTLTSNITSVTFTLPENKVYVIYFAISATGNSGDTTVSCGETEYTFINTASLAEVSDFAITYEPTTSVYTASWTNSLKNSTTFSGGAYTLKINGTTVLSSSVETGATVSVDVTAYIQSFLVNGRIAYWEITASDAVYTDGSNTYIAYKGGVYSNSVELPIVISDAPENLVLEGTLARWSLVKNATKYKLYVADSSGTPLTFEDLTYREVVTNQNKYDFAGLVDGLGAGNYLIVVQVVEDIDNGIYVSDTLAKKTANYQQTEALNSITNLTFEQNYASGQVRTYARWNFDTNGEFLISNVTFDVIITDKNGASVSYNNLTATMTASKFTYTNVGGDTTKGAFVFSYLDRSTDDKTRGLAGGDCVLTVVVSGISGSTYYTASTGVSGTYKNIFGLQPITNDSLFAVAPECFIRGVTNNEIAGFEEGLRDDFEAYESTIGFNEKYLIITDDTLSYAEYFKVYISTSTDAQGNNVYEYVGNIQNIATEISFDAISNTTAKLRLPNAIAGINSIKLIPYGDEEYFKYIDGGNVYDLSSDTAIERLSSMFDVELFMRNDAPNLNIHSIKLGYSDSQVKKNINSVKLTFSNLKIGGIYRVTPYYYDYYNGGALVECESADIGPLTADDFDGSVPKGLDIYNLISYYGPHEFYFTVQSIVPESEGSQYWLNSHIERTPNSFEFVTKLMEFAPAQDGDSTVNSLVNAITAKNAGGTLKNGDLYWTLPTHPYSIRVIYTVAMCDENQTLGNIMQFGEKHIIEYSVVLNINVTKTDTTYTLGEQSMLKHGVTTVLADNPCFKIDIDNKMIVFDMTRYFADSTRVADGQNGSWYLAGSYTYMITATAQAINEPYSCSRISSPATYGTSSAMKAYNYTGIPFPYQPTDVRLNSTGDLTWEYDDKIYNPAVLDTAVFEIWVYNWDENHENYTISKLDDYVYGVVPTNISHLLIAGGAKRNDVYIRTVSPDINIYEPSEWFKVNAGALPTTTALPGIDVVWGNDESLKNNDHRFLAITLDNYVSDAILSDIENNNYDVHINVSLLKVNDWTIGDPEPTYANYDDAKENGDYPTISWNQPLTESYYNYISYKNHEGLDYKFNFVNAINALVSAGLESEVLWLVGGDSLAGGYYYAKIELTTKLTCYAPSVVYKSKLVREVWRSSQEQATITGAFLTTKTLNSAASPVNNNDREWGEISHKEALLTIPVNTISYKSSPTTTVQKLPSEITVYAKLYTGEGYDLEHSYDLTYSIPDVSLIANGRYNNGDITLTLINDGDYSRINVTIDIHALFDENVYAGVYDIFWVLNGDEVGDSSPVDTPYQLREEICHYVVLPTPILDYRLSYTGENSDQYVINWVLTPNKYTYEVNDKIDYNVNIYAFVADDNGNYATDELEANDPEFLLAKNQKKYFVGNANASGSTIENYTPATLNDRRCYIQQNTIAGFSLTPNKTYKIYIYLSTARYGETNDFNSLYYLNSDTSVGVEYLYKKVSGQHVASDTTEPTANYPLEQFTDADRELVEQGAYYTFNSIQPDNYNNAFELYVYNTQDPRAGYDKNWTTLQEIEGTYLAHFIIGTKDNASASGNSQDLYILYDYQDKVIGSGSWDYSRSVGRLQNKNITLNKLTLSELLYNKVTVIDGLDLNKMWTPITYYCKIKTWINNNDVNANMPTYLGTDNVTRYNDKDTIYSKAWIERNVPFVRNADGTIDSNKVDAVFDTLARQNKQFDVPFLDINSLNLSCYFKFQHTIKYATPSLPSENGIEIVNNDGTSDYVGYSTIDLGNGVYQYLTDGYIKATSGYDYYYRIWLDNLYTLDPLIRSDKEIEITVGATEYDETTGGSGNYGDYNNQNWAVYGSAVKLIVHYVDENNTELSPEFITAHNGQAYIEIRADGVEDGVSALYAWMDTWLPNIFSFTFTAVTSDNPKINTGETNTANSFVTINNITGSINDINTQIERKYAQSDTSTHANYLTVRKQYTSPTVSLRYDTMQTQLAEGGVMQGYKFEAIQDTPFETNLVDSTQNPDYAGLASNPYLYSTETAGSQNFEYAFLKTNKYTNYDIILYYKSDSGDILATSSVISLLTNDVNNTLTRFAQAVAGLDIDSARFNYSTYTDIYPYEETCLYQAMYKLINGNQTTGNYHGGRIDIDIRVKTPSDDRLYKDNQNWVTSEWASAERNELATVYFHPRLETVKTTFNQSECNFTTDFEEGTSSFYVQDGKYYYYQSYIPLHYTTISRNTQYYIYLSREQGGQGNINQPYNIENSVVRNLCILSPRNTNTENIKNITDILKKDLYDAKTYDTSNDSRIGYANQWRLPANSKDTWLINIVAAVDDSMTYVGRGFNSKDQNYTVKLKIKMDIQSLSIDMSPLVNKSSNTLNESAFKADTLKNGYAGQALWKNYSSTQDLVGQPFNKAPNKAVFNFYYPYGNTIKSSTTYVIDANSVDRYYKLFYDFIRNTLMNDVTIRASDGFRINVKFMLQDGTLDSENVIDSNYSVDLYLNYYRNLPFDTSNISFSQNSSGITMSASYNKDNQIGSLNVTINQYDYNNGNRYTTTYLNSNTTSSGNVYNYSARASFDYNHADCFSNTDLSSDVVSKMINNCYTQYVGYAQGGKNRFTVTPVHDGYDPAHNLLAYGLYYDETVNYKVQYGPTVSIDYDEGMHNDENTVISDTWIWDPGSTDNEYIVNQVILDEYWGYVENITATYGYTKGSTCRVYYYLTFVGDSTGIDIEGDDTSEFVTSFGSGQYNTVDIQIDIKCKAGFEKVMSVSKASASLKIEPDVNIQKYVGKRPINSEPVSVMQYCYAEVTDGSMGGGSTGDFVGSFGNGGNRDVRASVEITANLPGDFVFTVFVKSTFSASYTGEYWDITPPAGLIPGLGNKYEGTFSRPGNLSTNTSVRKGINNVALSGQYWETVHAGWYCVLSDFDGGTASISFTGRVSGPTAGEIVET